MWRLWRTTSKKKLTPEAVNISGPYDRSDVLKRKKKRQFEFVEARDPLLEDIDAFTHSSSFVGQVIYDSETLEMAAKLNGESYVWCGVPARTYEAWKGADSKGAYFVRSIKGQFDC